MYRFVSLRRFAVALAVAAILGLAGPAAAGEPVPFKGSLEGALTSRTLLDPPFVFDRFDAEGVATQLGQFELVITGTVNLATRTAVATFTFTAANGDKLVAQTAGRSFPTEIPGVVLLVATATFDPDQSTGRFAGATGGFTCERLFDTVTRETIGSFEGTISVPSP